MDWSPRARARGKVSSVGANILMDGERRVGDDMRGMQATKVTLLDSEFIDCDLSGSTIKGFAPGLPGRECLFTRCSFDDSILSLGPTGYARFENCSFRGVRIDNWFWRGVELVDCVFTGRLTKGVIWGSIEAESGKRRELEVRGNDFTSAKFSDIGFRGGVNLALQRLPSIPGAVLIHDAPRCLSQLGAAVREIGRSRATEMISGR